MSERTPRVTVLGIGNTLMGDDGVGVMAVRAARGPAEDLGAVVVESENASMALVSHFTGSDAVIVVDAIDAGAEPGSVFRFSPDEARVTELRSHNIHGMGVAYLLTNARLLGKDPRVTVIGVQVGDVRPKDGLSAEVGSSLPDVVEVLMEEVASLRGRAAGP